jgi:hypothetical protein
MTTTTIPAARYRGYWRPGSGRPWEPVPGAEAATAAACWSRLFGARRGGDFLVTRDATPNARPGGRRQAP